MTATLTRFSASRRRTAYQRAGVDPVLAGRLIRSFVDRFPASNLLPKNYFCQILKLPPKGLTGGAYLSLSTDGVGTKLLLGIQTGLCAGLGQDLVAMIYNDLITSGSHPFAFLDYYATGKIRPSQYRTILASIDRACRACDMPLVGGETAEMPGLYRGSHFDLAGFGVGLLNREDTLSPARVKPGLVLVGFPSSGFHSNGFSLIRKEIARRRWKLNRPLTLNGACLPLKRWLLEPTRLYVDVIGAVHRRKIRVTTLSHVTGGGYDENLPRSIPKNCGLVVKQSAFDVPSAELFKWFSRETHTPWRGMMKIFNCGFGMVATCEEADVTAIRRRFPDAVAIGWVERRRSGDRLRVIP